MTTSLVHLRHRVQVQRQVLHSDDQGGFTEQWQNFKKVWMQIIPLSSSKVPSAEARGLRRSSVEYPGDLYKGRIRQGLGVEKGMKVLGRHDILIILNRPQEEGSYQTFLMGTLQKSDGGRDD